LSGKLRRLSVTAWRHCFRVQYVSLH